MATIRIPMEGVSSGTFQEFGFNIKISDGQFRRIIKGETK